MEHQNNPTQDPNMDPTLQKKHEAMIQRLSNRHQTRTQTKQSDSNPSSLPLHESTESFLSKFSNLKQLITSKLTQIESSPSSFTTSDLDDVSTLISDAENLIARHSYHLPSYEVRSSLKIVSDFKDGVSNLGNLLVPRKRFSFKKKALKVNDKTQMGIHEKSGVVGENEMTQLGLGGKSGNLGFEGSENEKNKVGFEGKNGIFGFEGVKGEVFEGENEKNEVGFEGDSIVADSVGFKGKENEVLVESFTGKDVGEFTLCDLSSCEVRLVGKSRAIFINKLRDCKVYIGPVMGSVLIDDVEGCVFVSASHQIRIHNAKKCDFYLRVRSRPIVEDSNDVRFAPYCLQYDGIDDDLRESRLDEETGNWANVDDFKWLRAVQSPNWSILPQDERISTFHVSC